MLRRLRLALVPLALLLPFLVLTGADASQKAPATPHSQTFRMFVTLYGFPDNSPPGRAIAFPRRDGNPTIHNHAGGKGTFDNPVTYATDKQELAVGTIVYYSFLKRYFIMEDDCVECDHDWNNGMKRHIDMWAGGNKHSGQAVIDCEDKLTQHGDVIVDPDPNLPVDTTPIFDAKTNKCFNPNG